MPHITGHRYDDPTTVGGGGRRGKSTGRGTSGGTYGSGTNPIIPTDPTETTDPTDPIDPVDPIDPIDPVDPTDSSLLVNPYDYYSYYTSDVPVYTTEQAYGDIGFTPTSEFLGTIDPATGLTYASLIPEYDPYGEERLRTGFRSGVQSGYESSVGQLSGITGQARQMEARSGFAGGGAIQRTVGEERSDIQSRYGQAFECALLDLTSGIREQRMGYQESLSDLLAGFAQANPDADIFGVKGDDNGDVGDVGDNGDSGMSDNFLYTFTTETKTDDDGNVWSWNETLSPPQYIQLTGV